VNVKIDNMRKATITILLLIIIAAGFTGYLFLQEDASVNVFDNEGRYDSSVLEDMGVIYSTRSDIIEFNEGYSESDNCPWNAIHNGIDFLFFNNSEIKAAAPGIVTKIDLIDWGPGGAHRYIISVDIRFNESVILNYGFEPWTNSTLDQTQQVEMFYFEVGTWVEKGDIIANFLKAGEWAHIHFGVYQDETARDPTIYMSSPDYNELLGMVHDFHPTWDISYP
jgi:murein DD-endopeptidase MepM/ murein hydrolase activator NlpD